MSNDVRKQIINETYEEVRQHLSDFDSAGDFIKSMHTIMRIRHVSVNIASELTLIMFEDGILKNKSISKEYSNFWK